MSDYLTTLQRDADDTLDIYNEGRSIVEKLSKDNPICGDVGQGKGIQLGKKLGQGIYGSVYDIIFADNPTKIEYVVKQVRASVDEETYYGNPITVGQLARLRTDVSRDLFISLNGDMGERLIRDGDKYMIPSYSIDCMTTSPREFANVAGPTTLKKIVVPAGSYLCDSTYTELLNGLLISRLTDITPHLVNTVDMITCTLHTKSSTDTSLWNRSTAHYGKSSTDRKTISSQRSQNN